MVDEEQLERLDSHSSLNADDINLHAGTHAIEEVQFGISFAETLSSSDYQRFEENIEEINRQFPKIQNMEGYQFDLLLNNPSLNAVEGKSLAEFSGDGTQIWAAEYFENTIRVYCKRYTRWAPVWIDAKKKLEPLFSTLDPKKMVVSIDLMVVDKFSIGLPKLITPSDLFGPVSDYICKKFLTVTDGRWDSQVGWFEHFDETYDLLKRLDVRSVRRNQEYVVSIANLHSLRPKEKPESFDRIFKKNFDVLDGIFSNFHQSNKQMLKDVLDEKISLRMGL